jgi:hypothetical protein
MKNHLLKSHVTIMDYAKRKKIYPASVYQAIKEGKIIPDIIGQSKIKMINLKKYGSFKFNKWSKGKEEQTLSNWFARKGKAKDNTTHLLSEQKAPSVKPRVYTLFGKKGKNDLKFTIGDLIPIQQKDQYDFAELVNLINYRDYEPDWSQRMDDEYDLLYNIPENKGRDFFMVSGQSLIIMPGRYIFPTILTKEQIINGQ